MHILPIPSLFGCNDACLFIRKYLFVNNNNSTIGEERSNTS